MQASPSTSVMKLAAIPQRLAGNVERSGTVLYLIKGQETSKSAVKHYTQLAIIIADNTSWVSVTGCPETCWTFAGPQAEISNVMKSLHVQGSPKVLHSNPRQVHIRHSKQLHSNPRTSSYQAQQAVLPQHKLLLKEHQNHHGTQCSSSSLQNNVKIVTACSAFRETCTAARASARTEPRSRHPRWHPPAPDCCRTAAGCRHMPARRAHAPPHARSSTRRRSRRLLQKEPRRCVHAPAYVHAPSSSLQHLLQRLRLRQQVPPGRGHVPRCRARPRRSSRISAPRCRPRRCRNSRRSLASVHSKTACCPASLCERDIQGGHHHVCGCGCWAPGGFRCSTC